MLAERRSKSHYVLFPRGKPIYEGNESSFGTRMLEKMGWSKGKGLGLKEDGEKDFIRVKYKNNSLGLGFQDRNDQWTANEVNFNGLLKSLNENSSDSIPECTKNLPFSKSHLMSGESLEEKSKRSRSRVHYKKFTKGKDISKYSEKDLANIFGKKSLHEVIENTIKDSVGSKLSIINTGTTVNDYFENKLKTKKILYENSEPSNQSNNDCMTSYSGNTENNINDSLQISDQNLEIDNINKNIESYDYNYTITHKKDKNSINTELDKKIKTKKRKLDVNESKQNIIEQYSVKDYQETKQICESKKKKRKNKELQSEQYKSESVNDDNMENLHEEIVLQNSHEETYSNSENILLQDDNQFKKIKRKTENLVNIKNETELKTSKRTGSRCNNERKKTKSSLTVEENVGILKSNEIKITVDDIDIDKDRKLTKKKKSKKEIIAKIDEDIPTKNSKPLKNTNSEKVAKINDNIDESKIKGTLEIVEYIEKNASKSEKRTKSKKNKLGQDVTEEANCSLKVGEIKENFIEPSKEQNSHEKISQAINNIELLTFKQIGERHSMMDLNIQDSVPCKTKDSNSDLNEKNQQQQDTKNKQTSLKLSTFNALKFRESDFDLYVGSNIKDIVGYGLTTNIKISVCEKFMDTSRIVNLFDEVFVAEKHKNINPEKEGDETQNKLFTGKNKSKNIANTSKYRKYVNTLRKKNLFTGI